jgi:hypothetical protein
MSALGVNRICRDGGSEVNDPIRTFGSANREVQEGTRGAARVL